jgi:iron complex transport system ATP-binding protein
MKVEQLSLVRGGRQVLTEISAALHQGEVTAILGPNGAGKSSFVACLAGLLPGPVSLDGQALSAMDPRARAQSIGLLPQGGDVYWDLTVEALVGLGRLPHQGRWASPTAADRAAIAAALMATDCMAFKERKVLSLSGGERARVLLARVLAGEPTWLLADEPLANLDPRHQLDVLAVLKAAAQAGRGVVVVLHDLALAYRWADRVLLLSEGRLVADGPPAQVLTEARIAEVYGVRAHISHAGLSVTGRLPA